MLKINNCSDVVEIKSHLTKLIQECNKNNIRFSITNESIVSNEMSLRIFDSISKECCIVKVDLGKEEE